MVSRGGTQNKDWVKIDPKAHDVESVIPELYLNPRGSRTTTDMHA